MAYRGFNCRASLPFVTDGTDEYFLDLDVAYPTGFGYGFSGGSAGLEERDRNAGNDRRLAGMLRSADNVTPKSIRVDVTPGNVLFRLALGDPDNGTANMYITVYDNASSVLAIGPVTTSTSNRFMDATGVERTNANWVADNVGVTLAISSGICIVKLGNPAVPGSGFLSHLSHFSVEEEVVASGARIHVNSSGMRW